MQNRVIRPVIKTHGGKYYLKDFIIENFPDNYQDLVYCEPMCAGASVFLNKTPSREEIICDIDEGVISIYKSLKYEPDEFISKLKKIKYKEKTFEEAKTKDDFEDYIDRGINEYILRRMSRGGLKKTFSWSERERGGQPGEINAWETMIKKLPEIAERVKNTTILCIDVFEFIKNWEEEDTLIYLDPPYLPSTREKNSTNAYAHEMSEEDHVRLLESIQNARGKIIISGYSSSLYKKYLKNWRCESKKIVNHSSQEKTKKTKTEFIWANY